MLVSGSTQLQPGGALGIYKAPTTTADGPIFATFAAAGNKPTPDEELLLSLISVLELDDDCELQEQELLVLLEEQEDDEEDVEELEQDDELDEELVLDELVVNSD